MGADRRRLPRPFGFPRQYRLTQAAQFERVLRRADWRKRSGPLRLHAVANTMPSARLGLVVAKRVLRRAADRNQARRVIRESFRINRARLPSFDVVVQVVEAGGSNEQFRQSLDRLWQELEARG